MLRVSVGASVQEQGPEKQDGTLEQMQGLVRASVMIVVAGVLLEPSMCGCWSFISVCVLKLQARLCSLSQTSLLFTCGTSVSSGVLFFSF